MPKSRPSSALVYSSSKNQADKPKTLIRPFSGSTRPSSSRPLSSKLLIEQHTQTKVPPKPSTITAASVPPVDTNAFDDPLFKRDELFKELQNLTKQHRITKSTNLTLSQRLQTALYDLDMERKINKAITKELAEYKAVPIPVRFVNRARDILLKSKSYLQKVEATERRTNLILNTFKTQGYSLVDSVNGYKEEVKTLNNNRKKAMEIIALLDPESKKLAEPEIPAPIPQPTDMEVLQSKCSKLENEVKELKKAISIYFIQKTKVTTEDHFLLKYVN
jgi:hypothetical protein